MMKSLAFLVPLIPLVAYAEDKADNSRDGVEIVSRTSDPQLVDLAIAPSISDRQPQDVSDSYPATIGSLYCWSSVKNRGEATQVVHIWRYGDRVINQHQMKIGKSIRWRTWSQQRINSKLTGTWSCEVVDQGGETLGKATVKVQ
ncbi:MAG: DUF2914 domain-containing protein [Proteobacteria bacterium]|nr:DUF2914 domain-containing protein [Pseudomonadota bacterium]